MVCLKKYNFFKKFIDLLHRLSHLALTATIILMKKVLNFFKFLICDQTGHATELLEKHKLKKMFLEDCSTKNSCSTK